MKVIVVGGGPAGMMAAIAAAENKNEVILIEKMNSLGRKLLISGKGRCNITSSLDMDDFIKNIPGNGKFLYSCFQNFTNKDIIDLLKKQGLETKIERGNRVFPVTDKSVDVLKCFTKRIKELNVKVMLNSQVEQILIRENIQNDGENQLINEAIEERTCIAGIRLSNGKEIFADKIIIATGGKSYPLTGSTGDGYKLAQKLGHTVTKIRPSLVPLECFERKICENMQGLSLKNVKIKLQDEVKNKTIYEDFGEMLFTHFGVSGPIILSSSAHLVRYRNIEELLKNKKIKLYIDLKPALTEEKLDERILRDFEQEKNKQFKNSLDKLLPQKMIQTVLTLSKINPEKKVNEITKKERTIIVKLLKNFELHISNFRSIDEAIVTSGGINTKEINPKTMESKIIRGLYFAGEVIDVDAYTGGFNLQIAYSTGYTAGKEI